MSTVMESSKYKHWLLEHDRENIVWLKIDVENSSTNVLSHAVLTELQTILSELQHEVPAGIAITSNKSKGFIAGADISEFSSISSKQKALEKISFGQQVFTQLEKLPCPSIAVINGFCMGGGLELALACDYRIALDASNTRISLPEIKLGIHPGYGGTVRIFRHLNPLTAMDLMLTGRSIDAKKAQYIGLIDYAVADRLLNKAACDLLTSQSKAKKRTAPIIAKLINSGLARPLVAIQMRKQVAKKARPEHYPAPYALINHWSKYFGDEEKMFKHEAESVAELSTSNTAKNLVRVFNLQNELKALANRDHRPAECIHIIGAGVMGGDIATWCVSKGLTVTLQDLQADSLAKAKQRAYNYFNKRLKDRVLIKQALDRFILDQNGLGLKHADIVIEAIFENKKVKRELYASIEPKLKSNALLATNTSSIEIEQLCDATPDPTRLVGLHFFNPVAKMPLVEVVKGKNTGPNVVQHAINFAKQIGKLPLPTKSSPGFLVNRILTPYMIEAGLIKEAGTATEDIDRAATAFGMPMGPLELADTVGLDVGLHVAELLSAAYGYNFPASFKKMVKAGNLGRKSGQGFYNWKNGKKVAKKSKSAGNNQELIQNRLILRFLNEAVACQREKVVENKKLLDAGVIFGTGFAPFHGGPIHYIENQGVERLLTALQALKKQYGERFTADPGWHDLSK